MRGEKTRAFFALTSETITKCVPGALQIVLPTVNHDGPVRTPHDSALLLSASCPNIQDPDLGTLIRRSA